MAKKLQLSVVGAGNAAPDLLATAEQVGREIAAAGCLLVCGGLGGVMAAACKGCSDAGGVAVGIVPGSALASANQWADVVIATGLGHARNVLVVQSANAVIALPGETGTLSEVAIAIKMDKPVVALGAWQQIEGVVQATSPKMAVRLALKLCERTP